MATTKVIKDLTEFNPGNPDYVLNATNAVTVINSGGNQYNFNGVYGKFGLRIGTTVLTGVPSGHPIAVLNNGLTGITYTGTVNEGTLAVGGVTYTFYSGDVTITVTADFGVASYYCKIHGYMGGQDNLVSVYSDAGLKMPTGVAFSGTPAEGMMRNDTTQDSQSSASTMQHYNGTNWKNFVNVAPAPPVYSFDLTNPTLSATKSVPVSYGNTRGCSMPADGTALYTTSLSGGNDYLHKYPLTTAYDVSSLGSATTYQTTVTIPDYLGGVIVNNDQSIIAYDPYSTNSWYVQSFGTNGDITSLQTASTYTCSRGGGDTVARSMIYADSQNKMYWMNNQMRKFDLTTAGDPSSGPQCPTAIANTTDSDFSSDLDGSNTRSLAFNTDGTQFTVMGDSSRLAQYTLSTAWDITTRGSATKFNFTTLLGGSYDLFGLFPNADYTKAVLTAGEQNTIFSLSL